MPFSALASFIGKSAASLIGWYHGTSTPSGLSLDALARIEALFKLPVGTLIYKVPVVQRQKRFHLKQLPQCLREQPRLAQRVTKHLPDNFLNLPEENQVQIIESIRREVLGEGTARRRKTADLQKLSYKLKKWPNQLEEEFNDLVMFKMGARAPFGKMRYGNWRLASKDKYERDFAFFFGALCLDSSAEDVRLRGLGIPEANLSIALIVCPLLIDWYIRFRGEIRTQYTSYLIGLLHFFSSLLRHDTGWLRQKPELGARLQPITHGTIDLVSCELIAKAQSDWDAVCDDAIKYYIFLENDLAPLVSVARDPFRPIRAIIKMDDPLDAIEMLINGMRINLPDPHTQPVRYHTMIRNCALVLLLFASGLRRNTIAQLDYTGDKIGHLIQENGGYLLEVPRAFFKQENSAYFGSSSTREDYRMELPNVFGLNEIFSEYLNVSRPFLLKNDGASRDERALFITSKKCKSIRLSPRLITIIYTELTGTYLTWNKWRQTGFPEVSAQGPHSARHLRATIVVRETSSFALAGDAIQITEETAINYYAQFSPKDRNKRVNEVLFGKRIQKEQERKCKEGTTRSMIKDQ